MGKSTISQLPLSPELLQKLQSRVSCATNIGVVVLLPDGEKPGYTISTIPNSPSGWINKNIYTFLFTQAGELKTPQIYRCAGTSGYAAGVPVFIEDVLAAVWIFHSLPLANDASGHSPRHRKAVVLNTGALQVFQNLLTLLYEQLGRGDKYEATIQQMSRASHHIHYHDKLLHLPNCYQMEKDVLDNPRGSLILVDITDLHKVNNTYGHDVGDMLLVALSKHMQLCQRSCGRLYSLNTVDFGLVLPDESQAEAESLARELLADCAKPWAVDMAAPGMNILFSIIVGVVPLEQVATSSESLASAMEYVVWQAYSHGGFGQFTSVGFSKFIRRRQVDNELSKVQADSMDGFSVVYQPIIDPATSLWRGVEALCRWQNAVLGNVSPEEFIPAAESNGQIFRIGEWVAETAIKKIKALGLDDAPQFILDINVSPTQLTGHRLENCIWGALEKYDYPAEKLCLEITESSEVSFTGPMLGSIERLAAKGVHFALDDFGTGYSTISELFKLPIKTVKIDRSLVQQIETDTDLQRLFRAVSEMAHGGGMHIVAEGVESSQQADALLMQGADYFQGYHFSKPISYEELEQSKACFYTSVANIQVMDYSKVDLNVWDGVQDDYVLPLSIYLTLSQCMNVLFKDNDVDRAIETVLGIVGQAMGVSRAGLFLRDNGGAEFSITNQWCAEGIKPSINYVQHLDIPAISPEWYASLKDRGLFLFADVHHLPPEIQNLLRKHDIRANAQFALMQGEKVVGFAAFDECTRVRYWTREEIRMLHILAGMLTGAIGKSQLRRQARLHHTQMTTILNLMDSLIYTSNLETGEILFANSKLLQASGQKSLQGKICWEVLHHLDKRCKFCPMLNLNKRNDPNAVEHLEFYSKPLDAHMKVSGSIIPWGNNRNALLVSCVNINELINQQRLLKKSAEIDPLTKAFNRAGFFPAAEKLFAVATGNGQPVALAFLDADGLKRTNDKYGHTAGDALLCAIVNSVVGNVRDTDIVARVGGDEFIVVFHNCSRDNATMKLNKILQELAGSGTVGTEPASFSYGVVDTLEHPYRPGRAYIEEIVDMADELQLRHKIKKYGAARDKSQTP